MLKLFKYFLLIFLILINYYILFNRALKNAQAKIRSQAQQQQQQDVSFLFDVNTKK